MIFHKHKFKKEGLNIWCECGKVKYLKCNHKWKSHFRDRITTVYGKNQIVDNLICENCGEIIQVNLTNGEIEREENNNEKYENK